MITLITMLMKTRVFLSLAMLLISGALQAQQVNPFIIVDQFGYLPVSPKIAVIRDPQTGFDAGLSFVPGTNYIVVNALTGEKVFRGTPVSWNSGATDISSGDKAWHFDFSAVTATGRYFILDSAQSHRSYTFEISPIVYREVLKHAVRTFFYQRVGFDKDTLYAGAAWADSASHMGPLQDKNCRLYSDKDNTATERDLSGGWYDAGDYNKYTNWTANYIVEMMKAYQESPKAWADDYNIPESGNGIPDLLDEAKWGIDHLLRMQEPDGSVLCIVSEAHASPPSLASGQSVYGPATTSASFNTAAAFAISAKVYRALNMTDYADTLVSRAEKAWAWGVANPAVKFHNNNESAGTKGVGAGDQEEDDYGRSVSKIEAACFLFEATGKAEYDDYFKANYQQMHLFMWNYAYPYEPIAQDLLLYYTRVPGADATISAGIRSTYKNAMLTNSENFPAYYNKKDPYQAHMNDYTWGSNNQKGAQGSMFYNMAYYDLDAAKKQDALKAAQGYIHYIHGVNPLNRVYLSNMYAFGGDNCANEFYHSWFCNGSPRWDRVGVSQYGPPPGYVPGGPNPSYDRDGCCSTSTCGSAANNALCNSEDLEPPKNQPKQKSYKDFNTSWPLNSWSVTENSCGYQVNYIKLLSKFVDIYVDCHGDSAGTAYYDTCGICSGGNTGRNPEEDVCNCPDFPRTAAMFIQSCTAVTSPSGKYLWTTTGKYNDTIRAANGCDSIIIVDLIIPVVDVSVEQDADTLTALATNATFRWLNCDDEYLPVELATDSNFTPDATGSYAVEVTQQGCTDTSACYAVTITGTMFNTFSDAIEVFPNPAGSSLTITLPQTFEQTDIEIRNLSGTLVFKERYTRQQRITMPVNLPPGIYLLMVKNQLNQQAYVQVAVK